MPGLRRTPQERELIYTAAMYKMTLEELNQSLTEKGYRPCPAGSFKMNVVHYAPVLLRHPELMERYCAHPPAVNQLPRQ